MFNIYVIVSHFSRQQSIPFFIFSESLWRQNGSSYFPRTLKGTEIIVLTLGFMWEFCSNTQNTKKSHVLADSIKTWKSHNISYFCKSKSGMWLKY